jgi:lactate dehydrogenase-like 2-hydroxyacid dehydrogenase
MRQLDEMTVLVVGLGGIGAACARRFHALGARCGDDAFGESRRGRRPTHPLDELVDAVAHVDAVVVTLPGTDQTHHLIDAEILRRRVRRHPGERGRGSVIDEAALLAALEDGTVSFAAIDVFESSRSRTRRCGRTRGCW